MTNEPTPTVAAYGIAWYNKAQYAQALGIMHDAHLLPRTYAEWFKIACQRERDIKSAGHRVVRAIIDPQTFPVWCALRNFTRIDANARIAFANEQAAIQVRN